MAPRDKKRKTKTKTKKKGILAHPFRLMGIIYVILLIALIVAVYFVPWIRDDLAEVMTVEYGKLNEYREVTCYFVKNETVYYANANGTAGYFYGEGASVRAGQEIVAIDSGRDTINETDYTEYEQKITDIYSGQNLLGIDSSEEKKELIASLNDQLLLENDEIEQDKLTLAASEVESLKKGQTGGKGISINVSDTGQTDTYLSNTSGIVSYNLDGYESELNKYTMSLLTKEGLGKIDSNIINVHTGSALEGKPLCKVVDDREWFALTWISSGELSNYKEGGKVILTIDGREMKGTVYKIYEKSDGIMVIMRFESYYENIATLRKASCGLTTSDEKGLVVKNSYIVEKDGVPGVYVLTVSGDVRFRPIKILAADGEYSLVASGTYSDEDGNLVATVEVYDQIKKVE